MSVGQPQRVEVRRLHDELETLIGIGKALTSHLSLEDVYRVVMNLFFCSLLLSKEGALSMANNLLKVLRNAEFYTDNGDGRPGNRHLSHQCRQPGRIGPDCR